MSWLAMTAWRLPPRTLWLLQTRVRKPVAQDLSSILLGIQALYSTARGLLALGITCASVVAAMVKDVLWFAKFSHK
jgi:hypothetical protein